MRLQSAYKKFFPAYMKELKKASWPIDVVSVHLYPASTGTPADRADYITQVKADMKKAKVPASKQLWDTEINYGIAGPGSGNPDKNIEGPTAAAWVAQTYLDDIRLGVDRAYWYYWAPNANLVGIQMYDGTIGRPGLPDGPELAQRRATTPAPSGTVNTCQLGDNVNPQVIAWASKGSGTFTVPANATRHVRRARTSACRSTPGSHSDDWKHAAMVRNRRKLVAIAATVAAVASLA